MGDGIRPKGSFPYVTLRYKETKSPCFGLKKCPDNDLCGSVCVHFENCQEEFDKLKKTSQDTPAISH